jgi:hypothetical protein
MLKKALEESISFEAIETRSGTRNFVAVDDNTNSQFRLFSVTTVTIAEKDKLFQLFKN